MPNLGRAAITSVAVVALALGASAAAARSPARPPAGARLAGATLAGPRSPGPRPLEVSAGPAAGSVDSLNSAGYAVSRAHARFASVRATFFVPYLNCAQSQGAQDARGARGARGAQGSYSLQWIGLGGFVGQPDSVEQDGIAADCSAAGRSSFHAWYAMYPRPLRMPRVAIRSGDSVTASVSYDPADATFALALTNNTTGGHFRVQARCPRGLRCPRDSAEVISSTPATGTAGHLTVRPLADYGAVSFSGISIADRAGRRGGLRSARWAATRIVQTRPAAPFELIARPTPIQADTFDNYWSRER